MVPHPSTGAPLLETEHEIIYAIKDDPLQLNCTTLGSNISIAWYYNQIPINVFSSSTLFLPNDPPRVVDNVLMFSKLKVSDSGWYTCAASNKYGRKEIDMLLVVEGKLRV